jgi:hypothetical protein
MQTLSMKKQGPMYIREESGELTPIEGALRILVDYPVPSDILGTNNQRDCTGNESSIGEIVVAGHSEWVISRKDYEGHRNAQTRQRYNERVGPAVAASIENNGRVTVEGFSRNANVPGTEAKKWLESLYKAGFIDKKKGEYLMNAEKISEAKKAFGIE